MKKAKLSISQVTPGMRLAEPITNSNGVTLMPTGIRLTPMFILRLKKWNIEELNVLIEGAEDTRVVENAQPRKTTTRKTPGMSAAQEKFVRDVVTDVTKRFSNVRDNPLMMELRTLSIHKLVALGDSGIINIMNFGPPDNRD